MPDDTDFMRAARPARGRGTGDLTKSRFDTIQTVREQQEEAQVETQVFEDTSRTILSRNDSPDVGMELTLNPYRGCEHGCIYCYARPTHEYLGLSAGLDFETRIYAKLEAPKLLRRELEKKSYKPQVIAFSGVTDCYQPTERKLLLTRQCISVLEEFRNPLVIITKSHLVTRDIDLLSSLARLNAAHVVMSITTLDRELARRMEPRASQPEMRLRAITELTAAGIPVSVNMAPIIPGLTDHEIPQVLKAAAEAGAKTAHYNMVRLPFGVKDLFQDWLSEHYPMRKEKVLSHIRESRNGKLNSAEFGSRMRGEGIFADQIAQMFASARRKYNLYQSQPPLSIAHFRQITQQLNLF